MNPEDMAERKGDNRVVTKEAVEAAATAIAKSGLTPTQRRVIEAIGGSCRDVGPHLREWKRPKQPQSSVVVSIDKTIIDAISSQICREAEAGAAASKAAAIAASDECERLAQAGRVLEANREELRSLLEGEYARGQKLEVQLTERIREIEEVRAASAESVLEALANAERERSTSEDLRNSLVRAELRLQALPKLEAEVNSCHQRILSLESALAVARQSDAVATAKMEAQLDRANEAAEREATLRLQLDKLKADVDSAWANERSLRQSNHDLARDLALAEGRLAEMTRSASTNIAPEFAATPPQAGSDPTGA